jgi:hypothetical protein
MTDGPTPEAGYVYSVGNGPRDYDGELFGP